MVPTIGGWRVELSRRRLRKKLDNRSRTSSSWPTASAWADAANDTPPTPAASADKEDVMSHRAYELPIPSKNALPDDYERYDDDDKKDEKVSQRTLHPRPLLPLGRRWYFPKGLRPTHPLPKVNFQQLWAQLQRPQNTIKSRKGHSVKDTPPTPARPAGGQMIVPRKITTSSSLPER